MWDLWTDNFHNVISRAEAVYNGNAQLRLTRPSMRVRLRYLCFVALILRPPANVQLPTAVQSQKWRVVRIAESQNDGFHFLATGFALVRNQKAYVITSRHILEKVKDQAKLYADFVPPVGAHPATILAADPLADILILGTDAKPQEDPVERIGVGKVGARVFIVGFDDIHMTRNTLNTDSGIIQRVGRWVEQQHLLVISGQHEGPSAHDLLISGVTCRLGGSGSPVFGTDGQILAVVKGTTDDGKCLAIGLEHALQLLEQYAK